MQLVSGRNIPYPDCPAQKEPEASNLESGLKAIDCTASFVSKEGGILNHVSLLSIMSVPTLVATAI